jgi:hypothetical protein
VLAATCIVSLAVGTENVTLPTVWQAVTDYHDIGDEWIVHDLRIPRTLLALLVGLALGLSGTLIQAVGRNPLADAEILGINSRGGAFRGLRDRLPRHDRHLDLHLVRLRRRAVRHAVGLPHRHDGPRHGHPGPRAARRRRGRRGDGSFLTDLVTQRNPQSEFSFLRYLTERS